MNSKQRFFDINAVLISLLIGSLILSCSKTSTEVQDDPPELPPSNTFLMDFETFDTSTTSPLNKIFSKQIQAGQNFNWAAFNIGVWNIAITLNMAPPVAAYLAALNQSPQFKDGAWYWEYEFNVFFVKHSAQLKGTINNNQVFWEMRISKEGFYDNFLWFTGNHDLQATSGTWQLNFGPDDPTPYLDVDWNRSLNSEERDIKYTNIIPQNSNNGSYIHYGITTDQSYNSFYDIFNVTNNNLINIRWQNQAINGYIIDANFFGNSEAHCWDVYPGLEDIICP